MTDASISAVSDSNIDPILPSLRYRGFAVLRSHEALCSVWFVALGGFLLISESSEVADVCPNWKRLTLSPVSSLPEEQGSLRDKGCRAERGFLPMGFAGLASLAALPGL